MIKVSVADFSNKNSIKNYLIREGAFFLKERECGRLKINSDSYL